MAKKSFLNKKVSLWVKEDIIISDLVDKVVTSVDSGDAASFIAQLDVAFEDWDITIGLIRHFKALELEYKKELDKSEWSESEFTPKKIKL